MHQGLHSFSGRCGEWMSGSFCVIFWLSKIEKSEGVRWPSGYGSSQSMPDGRWENGRMGNGHNEEGATSNTDAIDCLIANSTEVLLILVSRPYLFLAHEIELSSS